MFEIDKCTSNTNIFYLHRLHQSIFWKNATSFFQFQNHQILKIHRLCILYHTQGKNILVKMYYQRIFGLAFLMSGILFDDLCALMLIY